MRERERERERDRAREQIYRDKQRARDRLIAINRESKSQSKRVREYDPERVGER